MMAGMSAVGVMVRKVAGVDMAEDPYTWVRALKSPAWWPCSSRRPAAGGSAKRTKTRAPEALAAAMREAKEVVEGEKDAW